jgi:hypothetical protein
MDKPVFVCWLKLMAIFILFIGIDVLVTDDPANAPFMPGSTAWRGPFELLLILGALLMVGKRYTVTSLWRWFVVANIAAITLLVDNLWGWFVQVTQIPMWLPAYTMKPQDGVMLLSVLVIAGLALRLWRKGFDFLVAGHLALLSLSSAFLVLVHVVGITGVGHPMAARSLEALSLKVTSSYFDAHCHKSGIGCYAGEWKADGDYTITLSSDLSRFVYSQFIDTPDAKKVGLAHSDNAARLGGMLEINQFSKDKPSLMHAWNTGWNDISIIDQPEKYAVFYKNGSDVRIMVDYETAVYDKLQVNVVMRPLMMAFSIVWILTGLCLLLMHAGFARFNRQQSV